MFSHMFSKGCLLLGRWAHTRLFMSLVFLLSVMAKAILNVTVACCFYSTCLAGKRWCGFLWRKTRMRMRGDVPLKAHKRTAVKKGWDRWKGGMLLLTFVPFNIFFWLHFRVWRVEEGFDFLHILQTWRRRRQYFWCFLGRQDPVSGGSGALGR